MDHAPHHDRRRCALLRQGGNDERGREPAGYTVKECSESGWGGGIALNYEDRSFDKLHRRNHGTEQRGETGDMSVEKQGNIERASPQILGMAKSGPTHGASAQAGSKTAHRGGAAYKGAPGGVTVGPDMPQPRYVMGKHARSAMVRRHSAHHGPDIAC